MNNTTSSVPAAPFVKWIGGKRQLLSQLSPLFPQGLGKTITKYAEPFIGGGAMLFHIIQNYDIAEYYISDKNQALIAAYQTIKESPTELVKILTKLDKEYKKLATHEEKTRFYNAQRVKFNTLTKKMSASSPPNSKDKIQLASLLIFLNKTCFNGLYRENASGGFNSPHGKYVNPLIVDEPNIMNVHKKLQLATIKLADYSAVADFTDAQTFLYVDPPYRPLSKTSSFTSYVKGGFNDEHQTLLALFLREQHEKGVQFLLSNSDPHNTDPDDNFFDDLYAWGNLHRVSANRAVNTRGDKRGPLSEIAVTNY